MKSRLSREGTLSIIAAKCSLSLSSAFKYRANSPLVTPNLCNLLTCRRPIKSWGMVSPTLDLQSDPPFQISSCCHGYHAAQQWTKYWRRRNLGGLTKKTLPPGHPLWQHPPNALVLRLWSVCLQHSLPCQNHYGPAQFRWMADLHSVRVTKNNNSLLNSNCFCKQNFWLLSWLSVQIEMWDCTITPCHQAFTDWASNMACWFKAAQ